MNRIDHRPAALQPDGAQLQRRMLQDLERQWLDSWGAASAAQADGRQESAEPQTAAPASQGSAAATDAVRLSTPDRHVATSPVAAPADAAPAHRADRSAGRDTEREPTAPAEATVTRRLDRSPCSVEATPASPLAEATGVGLGTAAIASTAGPSAPELAPAASLAAFPKATTAAAPGLAFAAQAVPLEPAADAEPSAPAKRAPRPAGAGDLGATKFTLRELAPDLVQATLRDTQLGHAASQLAAQGLARALMEAGYAQVRVVVNGQHGQLERAGSDTGTDDTARPAASTDSFLATAPKDRIHGN